MLAIPGYGSTAPLPLKDRATETLYALRLRSHGMTYPQIATVMALYHGAYLSDAGWRTRLRNCGAPPVRNRGYGRIEQVAA